MPFPAIAAAIAAAAPEIMAAIGIGGSAAAGGAAAAGIGAAEVGGAAAAGVGAAEGIAGGIGAAEGAVGAAEGVSGITKLGQVSKGIRTASSIKNLSNMQFGNHMPQQVGTPPPFQGNYNSGDTSDPGYVA